MVNPGAPMTSVYFKLTHTYFDFEFDTNRGEAQ